MWVEMVSVGLDRFSFFSPFRAIYCSKRSPMVDPDRSRTCPIP